MSESDSTAFILTEEKDFRMFTKKFTKKLTKIFTKKLTFISCVVFAFSCISLPVFATSSVWKVSKNGRHLFLGGTIHVLAQKDYPLPNVFAVAYQASNTVIFETDIEKVRTLEFSQKVMAKAHYEGDEDIKSSLQSQTLKKLESYLDKRGLPSEELLKFKPWMLVLVLTNLELQRLQLTAIGVDEFYNNQAAIDKKKRGFLETAEQQLRLLQNMGKGEADALIEYLLQDLALLEQSFAEIREAWRAGDMQKLEQISLTPWVSAMPQLYDQLLVQRNNHWMPQIEAFLKTQDVEFVLFGALHLVGEQGVLAQLQAKGYKIEKL